MNLNVAAFNQDETAKCQMHNFDYRSKNFNLNRRPALW